MPSNRFRHVSRLRYQSFEQRKLLAGDLSTASVSAASYFVEDVQQESVAREYLASELETADLQLAEFDLGLVEVKRGLASTVTRFQQTVHGIPVANAWVTTIQGPEGEFVAVHDQSREGVFETTCGPDKDTITFADSEQLAMDYAGASGQFAPTRGELVWLPGEGNVKTARLVWQTTVFGVVGEGEHADDAHDHPKYVHVEGANHYGDFLTYIDAFSGEVISQENRIANKAEGSGDVFYPNPWQTQGSGAGLTDNDDATSGALEGQHISVTLEGLDEGTGLLIGEFVDLASLNSPDLDDVDADESSRVYEYDRDDPRFEQVQIYHTVDQINRYFHALGFDDDAGTPNGIRDFPTLANAHWYDQDQSFYSTGNDAIHFGDGGVDDGEDGDIIAHEYGHAIQFNQNASWGGGEMGAMGEGFGDYLAASFFQDVGDAAFQAAHAAAVGEWDATTYSGDDPPNLRRVDGNKMYPDDLVGQVHADGEIWSRALWDLNQDIGAAAADQLVLESHFMLPGGASMETAAEMILLADRNLNDGMYQGNIRAAFVDRGILEPLATAGTIALDGNTYAVGDSIGIEVNDGNAPNSIQVSVTSTSGDSETLTLTGAATYFGTLPTGDGAVSAGDGILQAAHGDTFTVSYTDADDGNGNSFTVSASADIENVVVHHSEDTPTQIIDNRTITSTITVSDLGTLLDVDLQLDITHSFVGDLTAVLTAPNGTDYTLFERIGGNGDNFTQTMFDDDATIAIGDGTAPFTGTFRGVDAFASLNGTSMTGDWVLSITDSQSVDQGTLNGWSLFLAVEPENLIETPEVVINDSSVARSVIDEVVVSFDSIVNVGAGAFELIKRGPSGGIVDVTPVVDNSSGSTVVTLEFSGAFTGAAGLIDGNYQLTVSSDLITSSSGTPMDGDGDGVPGGDLVFGDTASDRFFRFFGDNNGDRSVNLFDLLAFRQTWGSSDGDAAFNGQFDSNADGTINVFDLLAFRNNYAETFDFV